MRNFTCVQDLGNLKQALAEAVAVLLRSVLLVLLEFFKPCQKLGFQRLGHIQDAVGLLGLGLFQLLSV